METLIDALAIYALENLTPRFQRETAAQTRYAWREVEQLTEKLKALGPEAEEWLKKLENARITIDQNHERATLMAGISIGITLGRF